MTHRTNTYEQNICFHCCSGFPIDSQRGLQEKELMNADIHRAQLQVAVAEKEARASEKLGKTIGK